MLVMPVVVCNVEISNFEENNTKTFNMVPFSV